MNETEQLNVQVADIRKKVLGAEHPDTLVIMGDLASTYRNEGNGMRHKSCRFK